MYPCGRDGELITYPGAEDCCDACPFQMTDTTTETLTCEAEHV